MRILLCMSQCNQRAIGWVIRDKTAVSNLSKVILWMMAPRFEHTILWICAEHLNHSAIAAMLYKLLEKIMNNITVSTRPRAGRPSKLTERQKRVIQLKQ